MVATNATVLASALQAQGMASGVMQAGGMGMLVNPITNQPISGLTMGGYPQAGYPPIGYAPTGYAPGYPRAAIGMAGMTGINTGEAEDENNEEEEMVLPAETRSSMPVPRFHPIPTKPAFQRSEGMSTTPTQRTAPQPPATVMTNQNERSEVAFEAALDQAYLEGVTAAMEEVERKLDAKRQAAARAKLQAKILQQAESGQQQLEEEEEMRLLAMQQQALRQQQERQARATAAAEPPRLPPPSPKSVAVPGNTANGSPALLAGNLKTSVVSGVNEIFAPLLGTNQNVPTPQKVAASATPKSRQNTVQQKPQQNVAQSQPKPKAEVAVERPDLPGKPPVSPVTPTYGLLSEEESESLIMQAGFEDDDAPIRP
jgi:hypothetical protein